MTRRTRARRAERSSDSTCSPRACVTNAALRNASRHDTTAGNSLRRQPLREKRKSARDDEPSKLNSLLTLVKYLGEFLFEKRHPFILAGYRVSPHRHNWQGASTQCPFSRRFVVGSSHTQQLPFAVSSHTHPFA